MHPVMQRRRHRLMNRRTTSRHGRRQGLATVLIAAAVVFVALVVGSVVGTGGAMLAAYNYFAADLPDAHILDDIQLPQSTLVYDRTGQTLLARFECQNRESVTFKDVPQWVVDATVAVEDKTFWENSGVDFNATIAAFLQNLRAGQVVRGASTITQQVIKYAGSIKEAQAATPSPTASASAGAEAQAQAAAQSEADICKPPDLTFLNGRTYVDKIKENILALQVTAAYPGIAGKQKILETYLNLIFYGNGSYGIKAAAANYFGITDLSQLTLAQSAFLAGIPQLPSVYDPYLNPAGAAPAIGRRNEVLARMLDDGYITQAEYNTAVATTWDEMNPSRVTSVLKEPLFSFRVESEAEQILSKLGYNNPAQAFRTGGFKVITTLDYGLQQQAKAVVKNYVASFQKKGYDAHNGALVAVDSSTGEIIAYVGSADYYSRTDKRLQGQFDVAGLGQRQIGSAFKPITYTSAFQARKATPATMLVDAATDFGGGYAPQDADLSTRGPLLAMDALHYSLNIPSVKIQSLVTPEVTARFAESIGLASSDYILGLHPGLTLTLGSVPVNLTKATQSYEMFANQGTIHPATSIIEIRDRNNRLIYSVNENGPTPIEAVSPQVAYLTHWILEGNTNPKVNIWWGPQAELSTVYGKPRSGTRRHAGVKTGTTNDYKDLATFGYVPGSLVTGVWVGNSNGDPMTGPGEFLAAYGPLLMWHDFMDIALNKPWDWNNKAIAPAQDFVRPAGVTMTTVCRWTGLAPSSACGDNVTVPMLDGTQPGPDTSWVNGCLDLSKFEQDQGRPATWQVAAQAFADRQINGDLRGGRVPAGASPAPNPLFYRYGISTLPGVGHWPPLCGVKRETPTPSPSPGGSGFPFPSFSGGPFPSLCNGHKCSTAPSAVTTSTVSGTGTPSMPLAIFVVPFVAGGIPYLRRLRRKGRG
jgi:membrane peptidoglycan carboxypeptidase